MKRKLALLLAGTMVLSTVSTNTIFAANGEVALNGNMIVAPATTVSNTVSLTIGDNTQAFTTSSAFTFELVNATWDTTVADNASDDFKQVFVSGNQYNAMVNDTTKPSGSTAPRTFTANYKVTDASKPASVKVSSANVPGFQTAKEIILTTAATTGNNKVTVTAATGSLSKANGAQVAINSTAKGGVKAGDVFTLTLPTGYTFDNTATVKVYDALGNDQDVTVSGVTTPAATWALTNDNRTITVTVNNYNAANDAVFGGSVKVTGLNLNNNTSDFNQDIKVAVRKNSTLLDEQKIARFNSYGINAKITTAAADIPTINAGVKSLDDATSANALSFRAVSNTSKTADIQISENIANSFRGGDILVTLPKGVKVTGFKYVGSSNLDATYYNGTVAANDNVSVNDDGNVVTIKNLAAANAAGPVAGDGTASDANPFSLKFALEIQTAADFNGDVTATISGAKNTVDVIKEINVGTVAKVQSVVDVKTTEKEVKLGYTNQPAADIVITEKTAGTFKVGETFTIGLTDGFGRLASNFGFTKADVAVTSGAADISTSVSNNQVTITINNITSDKPLAFTVKNVQVYSDRNTPTYNGSDAVKVKVSSNQNLTVPVETNYIKFVSELSPEAAGSVYNQDVKITLNGTSATLADGTKVDLYGAPYISADGNYMAPVKGFAYALGLNPEDIVYDAEAKMATFFLADGSVAQIQDKNKYATVNGVKLPLIDANGNIVTPVIKDGRFYLPLRACAKTMFGAEVSYNAADKSVVLNPSK